MVMEVNESYYPMNCTGSSCVGQGKMGGDQPNIREIEFRIAKSASDKLRVTQIGVILYEGEMTSQKFAFHDFKTNEVNSGGQQQFAVTAVRVGSGTNASDESAEGNHRVECRLEVSYEVN